MMLKCLREDGYIKAPNIRNFALTKEAIEEIMYF